jgi:cytochrome c-type biogenesis protein CcmF
VWGREEPQRAVVGATMEVLDDGRVVGTMEPRMNFYPMSQQPVPTPDVRSGPFGDLYLNLMAVRPDGSSATVKAIHEPLVPWIWFGGGVVVFGAILGAWPARRRRAEAAVVVIPPKPRQDTAA